MAEIEQTPTLGLNKPPKGYFDWDVPLNENWDKLDCLGAGMLPLLTPLYLEHRLEGADAIGWAMQGSSLDGDEYKTVWEKLKTAKDRASQVSVEFKGVTYNYYKDTTTGWVFLDKANYDKAFENLKDSLGFVLTDVDGVKTIVLPKKEVYLKPSLSDANVFNAESLPNLKTNHNDLIVKNTATGLVQYKENWSGTNGTTFSFYSGDFDASRVSEAYQDGAEVNPNNHSVFIYYKVGNTIVNQEQIDVGNLLTTVDNLSTNKANTDLSNVTPAQSFKDMSIGWGMPDLTAGVSVNVDLYRNPFTANYKGVLMGALNVTASYTYLEIDDEKVWGGVNELLPVMIFMEEGKTIKASNALDLSNGEILTFYPLKGVDNA